MKTTDQGQDYDEDKDWDGEEDQDDIQQVEGGGNNAELVRGRAISGCNKNLAAAACYSRPRPVLSSFGRGISINRHS